MKARPMYIDSKNTLSVSWDAQVGSVEELQGMLVNKWWLTVLVAFCAAVCAVLDYLFVLVGLLFVLIFL